MQISILWPFCPCLKNKVDIGRSNNQKNTSVSQGLNSIQLILLIHFLSVYSTGNCQRLPSCQLFSQGASSQLPPTWVIFVDNKRAAAAWVIFWLQSVQLVDHNAIREYVKTNFTKDINICGGGCGCSIEPSTTCLQDPKCGFHIYSSQPLNCENILVCD